MVQYLHNKMVATLAACLLLTACSSSNNDITPTATVTASAELRVIHASADSPAVEISLDGAAVTSSTGLDYASSTGYLEVDASSYDISVAGILPTGNVEVISVPGFTLAADERQTVIAVGNLATIGPMVVADSVTQPAMDEVAIRVVHASPGAGMVDIYVTAPGDPLTGAFTLDFQGDFDLGAVPADSYQIRITPNTSSTVIYDSGTIDISGLAGQSILIAAINSTSASELAQAPVKLLVATDVFVNDLILVDEMTQAGAKVVHASPDAATAAGGPVEVFATIGGGSVELIDSIGYADAFPAVDTYAFVGAGDYFFDVAPDTDTISDSVFTTPAASSLAAGSDYTVLAVGDVISGSPAFTLISTEDTARSVAMQASVKVVHGAAAVGDVDVFVTPAGAISVLQIEGGMAGDPLLPSFAFSSISNSVAVAPGNYDIRVLDQLSGTVVINAENQPLASGDVITAVAIGPDEDDGNPAAPGLLLLSN